MISLILSQQSTIIDNIWLQLTLLLTIAVASHFVVSRFKQPTVMGEVIVGILIGPTLVGYFIYAREILSVLRSPK